jgi:hypothetical protein
MIERKSADSFSFARAVVVFMVAPRKSCHRIQINEPLPVRLVPHQADSKLDACCTNPISERCAVAPGRSNIYMVSSPLEFMQRCPNCGVGEPWAGGFKTAQA